MPMRMSVAVAVLLVVACFKLEAGASAAATVIYSQGEVEIVSGELTRAAEEGLELAAADELVVGFGGLLVVELVNGHVVRVDEDLRLRVNELALFGAPRARQSLEQQVAGLFLGAQPEVRERIVGFHARRSAGESLGAEPAEKSRRADSGFLQDESAAPPPSVGSERAAPRSVSRSAAPPPPRADAPAPAQEAEAVSTSPRRGLRRQREDRASKAAEEAPAASRAAAPGAPAPAAEDLPVEPVPMIGRATTLADDVTPAPVLWSWGLMNEGRAEMRSEPLPSGLEALLPSELPACLRGGLPAELSEGAIEEISLLLRIEEGRITRVALGGGLPAPECAGEGIVGARPDLGKLPERSGPFWLVLRIPLN